MLREILGTKAMKRLKNKFEIHSQSEAAANEVAVKWRDELLMARFC